MGKYQSGQMGQTVNLLSFDFGGSNPSLPTKNCGSSSVDRALAFQAEGRGFEPRLPLYRRDDLIISSFILHHPVFLNFIGSADFHYSTMFQTFQLLICYINNNIPIEKTLSYEDDY